MAGASRSLYLCSVDNIPRGFELARANDKAARRGCSARNFSRDLPVFSQRAGHYFFVGPPSGGWRGVVELATSREAAATLPGASK